MRSSPVLSGVAVPDWARAVLVVRDGDVLEAARVGTLRAGDYAYFLAPPRLIHALDRLFAPRDDDAGTS